jgi:hypothetical protein
MDSDRAADDGTDNAIRVEWVDEHTLTGCKRETALNVSTFRESEMNVRRYCSVGSTLREEFIAFVRLRFLRSFVLNSVSFVASEGTGAKS